MRGPQTGHDGPYEAPLLLPGGTVLPVWIDYNDHMNVAYYVLAFDHAVDRLLEDHLGLGEALAATEGQGPYALQTSTHYLGEMLKGEAFTFRALLLDHDAKRMHMMLEMLAADGRVAATYEQVLMNVDLTARRSTPYPDWGQMRLAQMLADHAGVSRPAQYQKPLGLAR